MKINLQEGRIVPRHRTPNTHSKMFRAALGLSLLAIFLGGVSRGSASEPVPTFEDAVRPILKANCFECHGEGETLKGKLDLRLKRFIEKGGKSGQGIVSGQPEKSLLLERIREGSMPPGKKKLTAAEIAVIEKWIASGAKTSEPEPETLPVGFYVTPQDRAWWAYQPVKRPAEPKSSSPRDKNPIDRFVFEELRKHKLDFSPAATAHSLIRRVTFDLTGLPPTPAEVDAFLADSTADPEAAYAKLIDRLLASPAYGEHWGRHWLDVAGYADSEGVTADDPIRSNVWRYRDYVIKAFNADKPFDQFVVEQLAGDELVKAHNPTLKPEDLKPEDIDKLTAAAFLRMAQDGTKNPRANPKMAREQLMADSIKIVSSTFLGLTVACAQCHHHRYDPISQDDYYRIRAFLEPGYDAKAVREFSLVSAADRALGAKLSAEATKIDAALRKRQAEKIAEVFEAELAKVPAEKREQVRAAAKAVPSKRTNDQIKLMREYPKLNVTSNSVRAGDKAFDAEIKKMTDEVAALRSKRPVEEFLRTTMDVTGVPPKTFLFYRGDPDQPKQGLEPGGLTVLDKTHPFKPEKFTNSGSSGRRLSLARWLTDRNHPLTARVLVNRVWMNHFGRGLVETPGDFGRMGTAPTHPDLLDWLAAEFMENGWSLKKLHKVILTSTTYRQGSKRSPANDEIDPDNRWLHRANLRRLQSESVRDAMLAVSGKLCTKAFGPPVPVRFDEDGQIVVGKGVRELTRGGVKVEPLPEGEIDRRCVYVQVRRSMPLSDLETFDAATLEPNCEIRRSSTVAPQALLLLNGGLVMEQSKHFAERLRREAGEDVEKQIRLAWKLAYSLDATEDVVRTSKAFLATQKEPRQALMLFAQSLLISNRFLYVD